MAVPPRVAVHLWVAVVPRDGTPRPDHIRSDGADAAHSAVVSTVHRAAVNEVRRRRRRGQLEPQRYYHRIDGDSALLARYLEARACHTLLGPPAPSSKTADAEPPLGRLRFLRVPRHKPVLLSVAAVPTRHDGGISAGAATYHAADPTHRADEADETDPGEDDVTALPEGADKLRVIGRVVVPPYGDYSITHHGAYVAAAAAVACPSPGGPSGDAAARSARDWDVPRVGIDWAATYGPGAPTHALRDHLAAFRDMLTGDEWDWCASGLDAAESRGAARVGADAAAAVDRRMLPLAVVWAVKEAVVKCLGLGFAYPMRDIALLGDVGTASDAAVMTSDVAATTRDAVATATSTTASTTALKHRPLAARLETVCGTPAAPAWADIAVRLARGVPEQTAPIAVRVGWFAASAASAASVEALAPIEVCAMAVMPVAVGVDGATTPTPRDGMHSRIAWPPAWAWIPATQVHDVLSDDVRPFRSE